MDDGEPSWQLCQQILGYLEACLDVGILKHAGKDAVVCPDKGRQTPVDARLSGTVFLIGGY